MAFKFRTLDYGFWRDMKIAGVPFPVASLLAWFITNEHSHYSGLYRIPLGYIASDTDRTEDEVRRDMEFLAEKPYLKYDEKTSYVWVVNMAKRQIKTNNAFNMILGVNNHLETIECPALLALFLEKYGGFKASKPKTGEEIEIMAPADMPPVKGKRRPRRPPAQKDDKALLGRFKRFWEAWPRKDAKEAAERAWTKLKPDEALTAKIVAAVERAKLTEGWQESDGKFIPLPGTYLNGKRWNDELKPTVKKAAPSPQQEAVEKYDDVPF